MELTNGARRNLVMAWRLAAELDVHPVYRPQEDADGEKPARGQQHNEEGLRAARYRDVPKGAPAQKLPKEADEDEGDHEAEAHAYAVYGRGHYLIFAREHLGHRQYGCEGDYELDVEAHLAIDLPRVRGHGHVRDRDPSRDDEQDGPLHPAH